MASEGKQKLVQTEGVEKCENKGQMEVTYSI